MRWMWIVLVALAIVGCGNRGNSNECADSEDVVAVVEDAAEDVVSADSVVVELNDEVVEEPSASDGPNDAQMVERQMDDIMGLLFGIMGEALTAQANYIPERRSESPKDYRNWDSEAIDGLYVYLDGVYDDDTARETAEYYYDGEFISEGWDYYAKISPWGGEYEITLGDRVTMHLYRIKGSDTYILFDWFPDVEPGDQGILDCSGFYPTFYKKP